MLKLLRNIKNCRKCALFMAKTEDISFSHYRNKLFCSSQISTQNVFNSSFSTDKNTIAKLIQDQHNHQELLKNVIVNNRYSPKERLQMLEAIWNNLAASLTLLNEDYFILKLRGYLKCNAKIDPKVFMKDVKKAGLEVSEDLLKMLLRVVAEHGDPGYVSTVVSSMKARNYSVDDGVFACLIIAHAVRGDMASARQVLTTMDECNVQPGPETYTALLRSAAILGDYAALHTYRARAADQGVVLSSENVLQVMYTAAKCGKEHLLPSLKSSIDIFTDEEIIELSESLAYAGSATAAYSVLKLLKKAENVEQCQQLLKALYTAETTASQIISVARSMVADGVYDGALLEVTRLLMEQERSRHAVAALQACYDANIQLRPHYFWPIILTAHRNTGENGIYEHLEVMKDMNVAPDRETLELIFSRLSIDDGDAVVKRVHGACGVSLAVLLSPYLTHLMRNGRLSHALHLGLKYQNSLKGDLLEPVLDSLAEGYRLSKDAKSTAQLLQLYGISYVSDWLFSVFSTNINLQPTELVHLLQELKAANCNISEADVRHIKRVLSGKHFVTDDAIIMLNNLVNYDEQSKQVNVTTTVEELECHVRELEGKGMNTRGALRKLVQGYCRRGDVSAANWAYRKMLDIGAPLSAGIIAAMMQVNVQAKQLDAACELLKKLSDEYPNFNIDAYKIIDLAALFVKSGKYSDALDLLKSYKQGRITPDGFEQWERNCWELLAATADYEGPDAVQKMFHTLIVNNFCLPSNVVLGPLIRVHLNNDNIDKAVKEFQRFTRDYKKTPLQQELITRVLLSEDAELLEDVLAASQSVHGPESTQAVFVSAIAVKGDGILLKTVLKESKNKLNNDKMVKQITRMADLGQIDGLQLLLDAGCDTDLKDTLIDSILRYYRRSGRTDEALEWWASLQQRGVELSTQQKAAVANLVASNTKV